MPLKQEERIRKKIASIRQTLAAERRKLGCYDDSRGIRYLPPELYLKLGDYQGGLTYLRWFEKNFPGDSGFPPFLFEWTIILFKNGKLKDAALKALKTFRANTYLFEAFFSRPIEQQKIPQWSNWAEPSIALVLNYSTEQPELTDFSEWLEAFISSEAFVKLKEQFLSIQAKLQTESDPQARRDLVRQSRGLFEH